MMNSASASAAELPQVTDQLTDSELSDCPDDLSEWSVTLEDANSDADRPLEGQRRGQGELQREPHSQERQGSR